MNVALPKRFWKDVSVHPSANGCEIHLDERKLKTPAKADLLVPNQNLANAIAEEWNAVEAEINPLEMHLTRCANAAIDKVQHEKAAVASMLSEYGATDLICYRSTEPLELKSRQASAWDPILNWLKQTHDVSLKSIDGVMFESQNTDDLEKLSDWVKQLDAWELTAFHDLVTLSGSLVLAIAHWENHISAEEAWRLSRVDEEWQEEQWGRDEEATKASMNKMQEFLKASNLKDILSN